MQVTCKYEWLKIFAIHYFTLTTNQHLFFNADKWNTWELQFCSCWCFRMMRLYGRLLDGSFKVTCVHRCTSAIWACHFLGFCPKVQVPLRYFCLLTHRKLTKSVEALRDSGHLMEVTDVTLDVIKAQHRTLILVVVFVLFIRAATQLVLYHLRRYNHNGQGLT